MKSDMKQGVIAGALCYVVWGISPLYWALLGGVNSWEVIAHRMIWSLVVMVIICALLLKMNPFSLFRERRAWAYLIPAAALITVNWSVYIIAVDMHQVVEAAFGYYINPLMSIICGIIFFKERLSRLQTIATILSACGVAYFAWVFGQLPMIALTLSSTFALYGVLKKKAGYEAVPALVVEGSVTLPFALGVLAVLTWMGIDSISAGSFDASLMALFIGAGILTAVPLILFAQAANKAPLSIIGFLQYIAPTLSLMVGVVFLGESFTMTHVICFGLIWSGIALVIIDSLTPTNRPDLS